MNSPPEPPRFDLDERAAVRRAGRPQPRTRVRRWPFAVVGGLVALVVGLALGDAFGDRPAPRRQLTAIRGIRQVVVTETVATRTITVILTKPSP